MIIKYTLDEGGISREFDEMTIPERYEFIDNDELFVINFFERIRKTRFKDDMALCGYKPFYRVEIGKNVWVVSVLVFRKDRLIASYYAHTDLCIYDENHFSISTIKNETSK